MRSVNHMIALCRPPQPHSARRVVAVETARNGPSRELLARELGRMHAQEGYAPSAPHAPRALQKASNRPFSAQPAFDGTCLLAIGDVANQRRTVTPLVCITDGWGSIHGDAGWLTTANSHVMGEVFGAVCKGAGYVGANAGMYNDSLRLGFRAGLAVGILASGSMVGKAKIDEHRRHLTVDRSRGWTLSWFTALSFLRWLLTVFRYDVTVTDDLTLHTQVPNEIAAYVHDGQRNFFAAGFVNAWHALSKSGPIKMPDIHAPQTLRAGETVSRTMRHHQSFFAAIGYTLFLGIQGSRIKTLQYSSHRYEKSEADPSTATYKHGSGFKVAVESQPLDSRHAFATLPGSLSGHIGSGEAPSPYRREFDFATAEEAQSCLASLASCKTEEALDEHLKKFADARIGGADATGTVLIGSADVGMHFSFIPFLRQILPTGASTDVAVGYDKMTIPDTYREAGYHSSLGTSGNFFQRAGVAIWDKPVAIFPDHPDDRAVLTLQGVLGATRANGAALNAHIIKPLRELFHAAELRDFPLTSRCMAHEITLSRSFTQTGLDSLWATLTQCAEQRRFPDHLRAHQRGLNKLLQATQSGVDPRQAIATFVEDEGLVGMAILHHMGGGTAEERLGLLGVISQNNKDELLAEQVDNVELLCNGEAPHPSQGAKAIRQRFSDVERALLDIEELRQHMVDDCTIGQSTRNTVEASLRELQKRLRGLLQVDSPAVRRQIKREIRASSGYFPRRLDGLILDFYEDGSRAARRARELRAAGLSHPHRKQAKAQVRRELLVEKQRLKSVLLPDGDIVERLREINLCLAEGALDKLNPIDQKFTDAWKRRLLKHDRWNSGSSQERLHLQASRGKACRQASDLNETVETTYSARRAQHFLNAGSRVSARLCRERDTMPSPPSQTFTNATRVLQQLPKHLANATKRAQLKAAALQETLAAFNERPGIV